VYANCNAHYSVGSYNASAANSRRNSVDPDEDDSLELDMLPIDRRRASLFGEDSPNVEEEDEDLNLSQRARKRRSSNVDADEEAYQLVRTYTQGHKRQYHVETPPLRSGQVTPVADRSHAEDYIPKPHKYRGGIHSSILKLLAHQGTSLVPTQQSGHDRVNSFDNVSLAGTTPSQTPDHSPPSSGATTPTRRYSFLHRHRRHGSDSPHSIVHHLLASSSTLALPQQEFSKFNAEKGKQAKQQRPGLGKRTRSSEAFATLKKLSRPHFGAAARITQHIAEIISRRKYLVKLCRALMEYGAPTHRLEGKS
jgi:hypothetical protein